MVVPGAPVNTTGANAGGALDSFGDIRTDVEFLLPQQRVGPEKCQLLFRRPDKFHGLGPTVRVRNSTVVRARSGPRSSCKKCRARSNATGPSACGSSSFSR